MTKGLLMRRVTVRLGASELEVLCDGVVVARHQRSLHKVTEDHVEARKPGALPGPTALAQARAAGFFSAVHERFWAEARAPWWTGRARRR